VTLQIVHADGSDADGFDHQPWNVNADSQGTFSAEWWVNPDDSLGATFIFTAVGSPSGRSAQTTFTDLNIGTYDQCSNDDGDGFASGSDLGCKWINGNLQPNNSVYTEGDATVQRLWLTDFMPGSTHTIVLQYGTTKQGRHAYDFLTQWNWSESWVSEADRCQDITGCVSHAETATLVPMDANVPDAFENQAAPAGPVAGAREFRMRGGVLGSER